MTNETNRDADSAQRNQNMESPLDAAQQSLGDALRTSFKILKLAIIVLVILFLASGAFVVEQNEQAIVLRLGKPTGGVREAGPGWAFPYPIDEVLKLPVKQSSSLAIDSHWLFLRKNEKTLPLDQIRRGHNSGLHPMRDGALLTADKGLVHVKWTLTYHLNDLAKYVSTVADTNVDKAEKIITKLLENAAIDVAGGFTTEDVTRKRLTDLRDQVRVLVNSSLERLGTGIVVDSIQPISTPPIQTRTAFDNVLRAENNRQSTIIQAQKEAADLLNQTAGAAHTRLIALLDQRDVAEAAGDTQQVESVLRDIDRVVEFEASGLVGTMISSAKGYHTSVVQSMRSDAEQYETLLEEYRSRPELLKTRLWQATKKRLLRSDGVTKVYRPAGTQIRIRIGPDPRQRERREQQKYLEEQGTWHPTDDRHPHVIYPGGKIE